MNRIDYLKKEIVEESRHHFIYCENNEYRKHFLEKLDEEYPIKMDSNLPMTVYINDIGLPKLSLNYSHLDWNKIKIISREFLSFSIASGILLKTKKNIDTELINLRIKKMLLDINDFDKNPRFPNITSFEELIKTLENSKKFYEKYYNDYLIGGIEKSIEELVLPFLELELFISNFKKALNNDSYFAIILDKDRDISISSTQAINCFLGSRCNKDFSINVVDEQNMWDLYYDFNGQYVENVHDYGIVQLDNMKSNYVRKRKK